MNILRSVPNVYATDMKRMRHFYQGTLGFEVVMDLGWIVTFASPSEPHLQLSALLGDPSGHAPAVSIEVDDVDAAYREMQGQGSEIVYPLTDEPWGVRRFFVRDPGGALINLVMHR